MKFIYLYGPPASGKLSVAEALKAKSDFLIYDNHKTIDKVQKKILYDSSEFWKEVDRQRFEFFEKSAKENKNLIFTHCYIPYEDIGEGYVNYPNLVIDLANKYNFDLYFVMLNCSEGELFNRVEGESRKQYQKLKDKEKLKKQLNSFNYYSKISYKNSIVINNSSMSPDEVANVIIKKFEF